MAFVVHEKVPKIDETLALLKSNLDGIQGEQ
jgi:hypothetical protein